MLFRSFDPEQRPDFQSARAMHRRARADGRVVRLADRGRRPVGRRRAHCEAVDRPWPAVPGVDRFRLPMKLRAGCGICYRRERPGSRGDGSSRHDRDICRRGPPSAGGPQGSNRCADPNTPVPGQPDPQQVAGSRAQPAGDPLDEQIAGEQRRGQGEYEEDRAQQESRRIRAKPILDALEEKRLDGYR